MKTLQQLGGPAALAHTTALMIGLVLSFTLMAPLLEAGPDQAQAWLAGHQTLALLWVAIVDWGSAGTAVILTLALYQRFKAGAPAMALRATLVGLAWAGLIVANSDLMLHHFGVVANLSGEDVAQTAAAWTVLARSLWVLSISLAALRAEGLPRALSVLGLLLGAVGLLTTIPAIAEIMFMIFGPGMMVWSAWVGIALLRGNAATAPLPETVSAHRTA